MQKLTIDDATYAAWQAQAAASGLDIVAWLKRQTGQDSANGNPPASGSVMDLAGCFPYSGPAVSKEDARSAARQHVADNFTRDNG